MAQVYKSDNSLPFYSCYGNKNGRQNRLKRGKLTILEKFEMVDKEINIEHKQIPKKIF